ncbi:MAG: peptidase M3, partial [Marmoricola sp.]
MEPTELEPLALPTDEGAWLDWVRDRAASGLVTAGGAVAALKEAPAGDSTVLQLWNDVAVALGNVSALASLMSAVHPDPAVIEAAEELEIEARRFGTDLHLDRDVFAQLSSLDSGNLDAGAHRVLGRALRGFRRSGVDLDEPTRERLRELNQRESELSQAFSRGIRDGRRTTSLPLAALDGLPDDYRAEHAPDEQGRVEISTLYPDTLPVLTHARDPGARRAVAHS